MPDKVKKLKKNWDKLFLIFFIITYAVIFSYFSMQRHNAFASNFDLTNMDHVVWNTLHGNFFSLRMADDYVSRFSIHADLILVLLAPLFLIWDNVRILLISQSIFLGLGAIPLYALAVRVIKNKIVALVIVLVFLLNPGMQWTNIYGFHGVSLAIPLLLSAFYFGYYKHWKMFALFSFLAILTKEEISLFVMMMGFYFLFVSKERKIGLATIFIGFSWFLLMTFIVIPYFSPSRVHWAFNWYGLLKTDEEGQSVLMAPTINRELLSHFVNSDALNYYNMLLKPFAYMPLLGFPFLFFSLPELAINILSSNDAMRTIRFHYDSGVTPSLAIAMVFGFKCLKEFLGRVSFVKKYSMWIIYVISAIVVLIALRVNYHYSPLPTTPSCWCYIYNVTDEERRFEKVLQSIPKDATVTASLEVRPHVNHRKNVYFVPSATPSAQFIALITQNRIIGNYEPKDYENKLIPILLSNKDYEVKFRSEHFYLFELLQKPQEL